MIWNEKNTQPGLVVASQTTSGDFKDAQLLVKHDDLWLLASLQDGFCGRSHTLESLIAHLNEHRFVVVVKMLGSGTLPENRAELPTVQITGLRGYR